MREFTKLERSTSILLTVCLIVGICSQAIDTKAAEHIALKDCYVSDIDNYIVLCDTEKDLKKAKKYCDFNDNIDVDKLENDNYIMSVNIKESEARELEKENVEVEIDYELSASNNEKSFVPVSVKENLNSNKVLEDNPRLFVPCDPVTDSDKKTEIVPWNISCISKDVGTNRYKGKNIKVAVIDSGIDPHDELLTCDWIDFTEKSETEYNPTDNSGHGTNIAGVIAARENGIGVVGIANNADLYSIKTLDKENKASVSKVIKAIEWCIDNEIDVINMSFGMEYYSKALEEVVKCAADRGIIMVAASGNNVESVNYPAAFDDVISVGAIDNELKSADFSLNNEKVDLVAPGVDVQTVDYLGSYCYASGTSIAAAHVTGVVASLLSYKRNVSRIKEAIMNSAVVINNGCKLINYDAALEYLEHNKFNKSKNKVPKIKMNIKSAEGEDEKFVEGAWCSNKWQAQNNSGHKSMINNMSIEYFGNASESDTQKRNNRTIAADACSKTDTLEWLSPGDYGSYGRDENGRIDLSQPACISPYHAKSEYYMGYVLDHMFFLYELARQRLIFNKGITLDSTLFDGDYYHGVWLDQKMQRRIIVDLSAVYEHQCVNFGTSYCKNSIRHKGYMILGVFLHLVQDIQAHRAKVTIDMPFANNGNNYYLYEYYR